MYTLEGDVEFLALELKKVRGRVTGGVRHAEAEKSGDGIPSHIVGAQRAWLERLDPISRKIQLQRLGGTDVVLRGQG